MYTIGGKTKLFIVDSRLFLVLIVFISRPTFLGCCWRSAEVPIYVRQLALVDDRGRKEGRKEGGKQPCTELHGRVSERASERAAFRSANADSKKGSAVHLR